MSMRWSSKTAIERGIALLALILVAIGPFVFNDYWANEILTQTFLIGIAAASLIFLSAYGGMVSLAQTALYGVSGFIVGNLVTTGGAGGTSKGLHLGWDPTVSILVAIALTTLIGLILGAVSARSAGIYFLMITLTYAVVAYYFFGQVTKLSGFSGIGGIDRYTPFGPIVNHHDRLYYIALVTAVLVYLLIRYVVRTPFGLTLQGVRDEPVRMSSLGYNVALHRTLAFGFGAFLASLAGILFVWWNGQIDPQTVGLGSTIDLLVIAVIGGLVRIEGAWLGAFAFIVINTYVRDVEVPVLGGSFNTIIGLIFLAVVILSPDGLMGVWDRVTRGLLRRGRGGGSPRTEPVAEPPAAGAGA